MDGDGDGQVTLAEFEDWWRGTMGVDGDAEPPPETPAAVTGAGVGGVGAKRARMAELAELIASGRATEADNIEIEQLETELAEADDGGAATGAGAGRCGSRGMSTAAASSTW